MSRSSIKPSGSPTTQDTPNDELAAGAEQGSYHETIRESTGLVRPGSGGGGSGSYGMFFVLLVMICHQPFV